jgi:hypothetical protein
MTDGVGKKIVEALKKQAEVEINIQPTQTVPQEQIATEEIIAPSYEQPVFEQNITELETQPIENLYTQPTQPMFTQQVTNNMYSQTQTMQQPTTQGFSEFNELEVPANVAVLKQLISQLPSGVSRQAGALVIKQTMEALGISMKSVLQEAQQLQETINLSARECQNNILECKKQINTLEAQVNKYQRQSASLNDIISLFVQLH